MTFVKLPVISLIPGVSGDSGEWTWPSSTALFQNHNQTRRYEVRKFWISEPLKLYSGDLKLVFMCYCLYKVFYLQLVFSCTVSIDYEPILYRSKQNKPIHREK